MLPLRQDASTEFALPDWLLPETLRGQLDHPWVLAAVIVVVSLVAAKLMDWLVTGIVRLTAKRTRTELDDEILDNLHGPIVKTVFLIGLWMACRVLEADNEPFLWVHRLIVTLVVVVWTSGSLRTLGVVLRVMARRGSRFHAVDPRTLPLFSNLGKLFIVAIALYLAIQVWDLDATGWLASAGVAGIALGFAAKDTLANLFAGVFIIADAPYRVGDYVDLDSGYRGRVQQIGLRSTRILTRDDIEITVPNSVIGNGAIVNESSGAPRYRVRVKVGVAYGSDIDQVRAVLVDVADKVDMTMDDPAPRVRFRSFGDSALEFELLAWIQEPELRGRTLDALYSEVYKRFTDESIEIAFPQRDLHVRSLPEGWHPPS
jgi:small-conductance mechanosensitive channel